QGGRIIAITYAPGGQRGTWQPWVAMGSAKAALESLVRYFAVALAPRGITVNSVSPGLTDDSVLQSFGDAAVDIARKWHGSGWTPMGRMGTPADIGNVVGLLCSPEAGWITGQLIYADGGASLVDTLLPLEIQRGGGSDPNGGFFRRSTRNPGRSERSYAAGSPGAGRHLCSDCEPRSRGRCGPPQCGEEEDARCSIDWRLPLRSRSSRGCCICCST